MITMDRIYDKFPRPIAHGDYNSGNHRGEPGAQYCIGGAYIMTRYGLTLLQTMAQTRFPSDDDICEALLDDNPALTEDRARRCAHVITRSNDQRRFARGWRILDYALRYTTALEPEPPLVLAV